MSRCSGAPSRSSLRASNCIRKATLRLSGFSDLGFDYILSDFFIFALDIFFLVIEPFDISPLLILSP